MGTVDRVLEGIRQRAAAERARLEALLDTDPGAEYVDRTGKVWIWDTEDDSLCTMDGGAWSPSYVQKLWGPLTPVAAPTVDDSELREQFAGIEHDRWARWQRHVHNQCVRNPDGSLTIPAAMVEKWQRQMDTAYADLTEAEKEKDRRKVNPYLLLRRDTNG